MLKLSLVNVQDCILIFILADVVWRVQAILEGDCGFQTNRQLFVPNTENNKYVQSGDWPWIGSLRNHVNDHVCSALLVSPYAAVTTASCFEYESYLDQADLPIVAIFGSIDKRLVYTTYQHVSRFEVIVHPNYDAKEGFDHDIAVLRLDIPVDEFTNHVHPICVNSVTEEVDDFYDCRLAGWGWSKDLIMPQDLQSIVASLSPPLLCESMYGVFNNQSFLCVGPTTKICYSDLGSPLMCLTSSGRWTLVGLSSYETVDCDFKPVGYTRISSYLDFIKDNGASIPASHSSLCICMLLVHTLLVMCHINLDVT